jgi:ubiquinol-cytochrome c reductase cytochrome c subunit
MRRTVIAIAAFLCGGLALIQFAAASERHSVHTSKFAPTGERHSALVSTSQRVPSSLLASGRTLFLSSCSACHGMNAEGIRGRGPSLHGVGALAADFYLQTGRMPLPSPRSQPLRTSPAFSQAQIEALVAYVASFGGPPIPTVSPRAGSLADGQRLFGLDCAGCHTIQGQGGIVTGAIVPSLNQATPTQVAQAIRIGPYVMPRFGPGELSSAQIDSIARYVQSIQHPEDRGGWGIGRIGPIPEGMVAWLLAAAALLLIARLLGERTPEQPEDLSGRGASR